MFLYYVSYSSKVTPFISNELLVTNFSCNAVDIASDGSMVAGGFSNSTVRIWELKKNRQTNQGNARYS